MFRFLAALVLLALAAPLALAAERIESFHSHIVVEKGGDLVVTETITVRAEGNEIKRGIFRDIPRLQSTRSGLKTKKPFKVLSVRRDGMAENFRTSKIGKGGIRIRIGRAEVFLKPGSYTYEIIYRTGRQLYFEEERDALYWNVNGTEWGFPTDKVTATVKLPEGIKGTKVWGYTGKRGAKGKDYTAELTGTGATIEATRPFRSKENLTVVLEWPPGLLEERAYEEARGSLFRDHPPAALGLVLLAGAFVYYLVAWIKVGKDPAKGIIIPLYGPPEGLSAAAVRYIDQMGHDNKCFSAGVVGLAAKGEATIEKDGKVYVLHPKMLTPAQKGELLELLNEGEVKELEALKGISMRRAEGIREARPYEQVEDVLRVKGIGKGALAKMINHMSGTGDSPGEPLAADETGLHKKLFGAGSLRLKQSNHARIGGALKAHKRLLASQVEKVHFIRNLVWWVPGLLLSLLGGLVFLLATVATGLTEETFLALLALLFLSLTSVVLVRVVELSVVRRGKDVGGGGWFLLLLVLGIWGFCFVALMVLSSFWVGGAVLYAVVLNQVFYHLIKAPTNLGQRVRDQIEGFRRYLSVAEEERLNLENPPEKTPELFERFLPYALALGCEQQWAEKFDEVLQAAGVAPGDSSYSPSYYSDSGSSGSLSGAMSDLGGSFTGSLSSSASAPSSGGGGGGGGGGSGGGGGGGGGGGW